MSFPEGSKIPTEAMRLLDDPSRYMEEKVKRIPPQELKEGLDYPLRIRLDQLDPRNRGLVVDLTVFVSGPCVSRNYYSMVTVRLPGTNETDNITEAIFNQIGMFVGFDPHQSINTFAREAQLLRFIEATKDPTMVTSEGYIVREK